MQRIVINKCYGGFGLSDEAMDLYKAKSGVTKGFRIYDWHIKRDDPNLVEVIEELGEKANGVCADLKIVEIPDDVKWVIDEYDGLEQVAEKHRIWS